MKKLLTLLVLLAAGCSQAVITGPQFVGPGKTVAY
ncbi:hypothetical protein LCGC14_2991570, partial [marine sediment metagenome]